MTAPEIDLAFSLESGGSGAAPAPEPLTDPAVAEALWCGHLGAWLAQLLPELPASLRAAGYSLGLELTGDATIAELNQAWRQHSGPTDVLAFAAQEEAPPAPAGVEPDWLELGDIVISLDTARRQAEAAGHGLQDELLFLASHGLLHLLGWDHPDDDSLEAMLARQTALLEASPS
ncbi:MULTISPECIES: rRNA maturation RNase YbeY [Cyanophyceae]|jgi:probable rRNA maturation factor|uniref:Endoribonuclease YbeY n=1 Tax=Aphanothece cf. minutissima CCALA 015 TaxID=2107695 RepID=A0ABX5FB62_9CHRO|nr:MULTISPECIES: rRNA maturation RNase YbeY [Cyanophyceae]MCP9933806.1 rRNA maturation RNase YbeY [Cyanobium sp. Candia 9D4]PSB39160.1 rRNA maturation RNase YbeY [Aphanothece cf. minutissima CCALA 015]